MDPISLIGALAGAAGSFIGAGASADAQDKNWQVNLLNYYLRERERRDRIQAAQESRRDTKLGATDARGNRTYFKEGQGWVQELSPEDEQLQDAQLREQFLTLAQDLPRRRRQEVANESRRGREGVEADSLLNAFGEIQRENPRDFESLLRLASSEGINSAFDDSTGDALKSATRMGSSNAGSIVSSIGRARSDALSRAFLQSRIDAERTVGDRYDQKRNQAFQLYDAMAGRASGVPNVSYNPQRTGGNTDALMSQFASLFAGDNRALEGAFGQKGGEVDYMQPDMGLANAFATTGSLLGGLSDDMRADRYLDERRRLRKTSPGVY